MLTNLLSNICEAIFEQSVVLPEPLAPFTKIISDSKILSSHGETNYLLNNDKKLTQGQYFLQLIILSLNLDMISFE